MNCDVDGLRDKPVMGEPFKDNHLKSILEKLYPNHKWIYNKGIKDSKGKCFKDSAGHSYRPDAHNVELKLVVEVDGDAITFPNHFSKEEIAQHDIERDNYYKDLGYKVIAIPFYVQLDEEMIRYYFNIEYSNRLYEAASMHGFLHSKSSLPVNFCPLGLKRFENDMKILPNKTRSIIVKSLNKRIQQLRERGKNEEDAINAVMPKSLLYLLDLDIDRIDD